MNEVRTRIAVGSDHRISGTAPDDVPSGEHEVTISIADRLTRPSAQPFDDAALPRRDVGPWPAALSLRREDMYGDDGR